MPSFPKPARGEAKREHIDQRMKLDSREDTEKAKARKRDGRCRWPHATALDREVCRRSVKEAAHFKAKGMGGDHGKRTSMDLLIVLCKPTHQGPGSLHAGEKRIVPLTDRMMSGPCAFFEKRGRRWFEVGHEISLGLLARTASYKGE